MIVVKYLNSGFANFKFKYGIQMHAIFELKFVIRSQNSNIWTSLKFEFTLGSPRPNAARHLGLGDPRRLAV